MLKVYAKLSLDFNF